jgi:Domain of unknown function (DUF4340)
MNKSTAIILVAALALAAFVYFYDVKHTKTTEEKEALAADTGGTNTAFMVETANITTMTIDREGTTATFEQRNGTWFMTTPVDTRAEQSDVGGVAGQLGSIRINRTLPDSSTQANELGTYGLTSPAVTIHFTLKNGQKHELRLGNKDFSGSYVYGLIDEQKDVVLLPESILISSNKAPDDFRDQSALSFDANTVVSFQLRNSSGEIEAVKKGSDWQIEKPRQTRADNVAVSSLLDSVSTTRVAAFINEKDASANLGKYGLNAPVETFKAQLADNKTVEIELGKKDGDIYYARDISRPFIFKVKEPLFRSMDAKIGDLRDKKLVRVDESNISKMQVDRGVTAAVCTKDVNGDWKAEQAAQSKAKPTYCANAWNALNDAHVSEVYDTVPASAAAAMEKPEYRVSITDKAGKRTDLEISKVADGAAFVKEEGQQQVYKVGKEIDDQLDVTSHQVHD